MEKIIGMVMVMFPLRRYLNSESNFRRKVTILFIFVIALFFLQQPESIKSVELPVEGKIGQTIENSHNTDETKLSDEDFRKKTVIYQRRLPKTGTRTSWELSVFGGIILSTLIIYRIKNYFIFHQRKSSV